MTSTKCICTRWGSRCNAEVYKVGLCLTDFYRCGVGQVCDLVDSHKEASRYVSCLLAKADLILEYVGDPDWLQYKTQCIKAIRFYLDTNLGTRRNDSMHVIMALHEFIIEYAERLVQCRKLFAALVYRKFCEFEREEPSLLVRYRGRIKKLCHHYSPGG